jgi:hypothetical protein
MPNCVLRCFHAASVISILSLIAQSVPVLATTSESNAVESYKTFTSEVASAVATHSSSATLGVGTVNTQSATPSILAQTARWTPNTLIENQTTLSNDTEDQITSVSQLSDVQPTDWAFQALQSLVERYACITGYPDRTFRGNRALTRYEFAAGLNACLNRVSELITVGTANLIKKEDLTTLQNLQQQFVSELATLRDRIDTQEAQITQLTTQQFSTTSKLAGQVIFAVNVGGFSGNRIVDPRGVEITTQQPNATFLYRASVDLNTSFSGTDLLKIRLDTVSGFGKDNAAGFLEPNFGSVLEYTIRGTPNRQLGVSRLYYSFNPSKDISISLGPTLVTTDYIDLNNYANGIIDFSTYSLVNNLILFPINGPSAGGVINWNPGHGAFKLRALYAAADAANPDPNNRSFVPGVFSLANLLYPKGGGSRGLFGDPYQVTAELEYSPSKAFAARIEYSGGNIFGGRFDVVGANIEWGLSPKFAIFGRYGYGSYNNTAFGDINPNYWMAGISWRDLFVPGAVAGVAVGQPFIERAIGSATQTNVEAFYNYPVNDNIRVSPLIQVITNPANQSSNGTILTGSIRTIFSF